MPFFLLSILHSIVGSVVLPVHAHVKWFVEDAEPLVPAIAPYELSEPSVLIWLGVVGAFVCVAYLIQKYNPVRLPAWTRWSHPTQPRVVATALRIVGIWLIVSSTTGTILAPHSYNFLCLLIQVCAGVLLLIGRTPKYTAVLLILLWTLCIGIFGPDFFDWFYLVGIAAVVVAPKDPRSLRILALTLGVSLSITAFNEKILAPDLAVEFLHIHPWNFMHALGIDYSDRLFILSAGMMEIVFGLLLITGWVTRLTILGIAPILLLTAIILGPAEVLGHLPLFVVAGLLLIYGNPLYQKK